MKRIAVLLVFGMFLAFETFAHAEGTGSGSGSGTGTGAGAGSGSGEVVPPGYDHRAAPACDCEKLTLDSVSKAAYISEFALSYTGIFMSNNGVSVQDPIFEGIGIGNVDKTSCTGGQEFTATFKNEVPFKKLDASIKLVCIETIGQGFPHWKLVEWRRTITVRHPDEQGTDTINGSKRATGGVSIAAPTETVTYAKGTFDATAFLPDPYGQTKRTGGNYSRSSDLQPRNNLSRRWNKTDYIDLEETESECTFTTSVRGHVTVPYQFLKYTYTDSVPNADWYGAIYRSDGPDVRPLVKDTTYPGWNEDLRGPIRRGAEGGCGK